MIDMVKSIGYSILPTATQDTVRFTSCGHEKHETLFVQNRETTIHPPPRAALIMVCPQPWLITTLVSEQYRLPTIGRPRALAYSHSHTVYLPIIIIGMNGRGGGGVMLTWSARRITHFSTVKITHDHFITTWVYIVIWMHRTPKTKLHEWFLSTRVTVTVVVSSLIDVELNPSKFKTVLSAFLCWSQVYVSPAFSTLKWSELAAYGYFVDFVPGRPHNAKQVAPYHGRRMTWRAAGPRLGPGSRFF